MSLAEIVAREAPGGARRRGLPHGQRARACRTRPRARRGHAALRRRRGCEGGVVEELVRAGSSPAAWWTAGPLEVARAGSRRSPPSCSTSTGATRRHTGITDHRPPVSEIRDRPADRDPEIGAGRRSSSAHRRRGRAGRWARGRATSSWSPRRRLEGGGAGRARPDRRARRRRFCARRGGCADAATTSSSPRRAHGFVCASAGVDRSNTPGDDWVVLLPGRPGRIRRGGCVTSSPRASASLRR